MDMMMQGDISDIYVQRDRETITRMLTLLTPNNSRNRHLNFAVSNSTFAPSCPSATHVGLPQERDTATISTFIQSPGDR